MTHTPSSALKPCDESRVHLLGQVAEACSAIEAGSCIEHSVMLNAASAKWLLDVLLDRTHSPDDGEVKRLRTALIEMGRMIPGCVLRDEVSTDFLMLLPEEMRVWKERCNPTPKDKPTAEGGEAIHAREAAFLVSLAEHGIEPSVGELLTLGDNRGTVAPGALRKALHAALQSPTDTTSTSPDTDRGEADDDDPCANGGHCCCCGPGEPCCDCGQIMPHPSCIGEKCWCGAPAAKKVGEEVPLDDPMPARHNLTAYVCANHYAQMMGPAGAEQVGQFPTDTDRGDFVLVPREPTEAMLGAGQDLWLGKDNRSEDWSSKLSETWTAMLNASPAGRNR